MNNNKSTTQPHTPPSPSLEQPTQSLADPTTQFLNTPSLTAAEFAMEMEKFAEGYDVDASIDQAETASPETANDVVPSASSGTIDDAEAEAGLESAEVPADEPDFTPGELAVLEEFDEESDANGVVPASEEEVERLWAEVGFWINRGRVAEFIVGMLLNRLQQSCEHGEFLKGLALFSKDWGVSRATLYRRLDFYKRVCDEHVELIKVKLTDADWAEFGIPEDIGQIEEKLLANDGDAQAKLFEEHIRAIAKKVIEQVQKHKELGLAPAATVKIDGLEEDERKHLRDTVAFLRRKLGDERFKEGLLERLAQWRHELPEDEEQTEKKPRRQKKGGLNA